MAGTAPNLQRAYESRDGVNLNLAFSVSHSMHGKYALQQAFGAMRVRSRRRALAGGQFHRTAAHHVATMNRLRSPYRRGTPASGAGVEHTRRTADHRMQAAYVSCARYFRLARRNQFQHTEEMKERKLSTHRAIRRRAHPAASPVHVSASVVLRFIETRTPPKINNVACPRAVMAVII